MPFRALNLDMNILVGYRVDIGEGYPQSLFEKVFVR
ncbi:Uncharacterised protein [Oligella urethralis]|uniref:Uncharacterized protein n=1 Tax=Oligella urethralis TaxID=90245 RepID=A0A2X1VJP3_9BURK|nr:Uncharacterised protein [Oligella urethralis]